MLSNNDYQHHAYWLRHYKISDMDDASDPSYYGFVGKKGEWYIQELNDSTGQIRYARGTSAYTTNWTNRAGLTYDYFDSAF